ncbi:response regulator [candidate division KSB1 bacterium]|nr:response regulator [candidate division KSB1 bacterium]
MRESQTIRVMVIDDEKATRDVFEEIFEGENFSVFPAEDGLKAIAEMKKRQYDLAFIDIRMPQIDGLETLRRLKKIHPDLMAVMISGFRDEDIIEKALKIGAVGYLYKPLDIQDILGVALKCSHQLGVPNQVEIVETNS